MEPRWSIDSQRVKAQLGTPGYRVLMWHRIAQQHERSGLAPPSPNLSRKVRLICSVEGVQPAEFCYPNYMYGVLELSLGKRYRSVRPCCSRRRCQVQACLIMKERCYSSRFLICKTRKNVPLGCLRIDLTT